MAIQLHKMDQPLKHLEVDLIYRVNSTLDRDSQSDEDFSEILSLFERIHFVSSSMKDIRDLIAHVEDVATQSDTDRRNFKSPYHRIILAYGYYLVGDLGKAETNAELSATGFRTQSKYWHEAVSQWFLSLLFYEMGRLDKASEKEKNALQKISNLDVEYGRLGYYVEGYESIHDAIEKSCAAVKEMLLSGPVALRQDIKIVPVERFSTIIEWLDIPKSDFQLSDYRKKISPEKPIDIEFLNGILSALGKRFENRTAEESGDPIVNLLVAHCYNLGFLADPVRGREYQFEAVEYAEYALSDFQDKNDDYNHALCCWYIGLMLLNNKKYATFQILVTNGLRLLDVFTKNAQSTNQYAQNADAIKKEFFDWLVISDSQYKNSQKSTLNSPSRNPRMTASTGSQNNKDVKNEQRVEENTGPSETPFSQNRKEMNTTLPELRGVNSSKLSKQDNLPNLPAGRKGDSNFRLLVVPVDLDALDSAEILNSPLGQEPDLFRKLESFGMEYITRKGSPVEPASRKPIPPKTIIRSFPVSHAGLSASLENPDKQEMAGIVDETLRLRIHDKKYEVFLTKGIKDVLVKNHEWFLVTEDGMNNSDPIPIDENDYVLVNKKNCSPKFCNGKIVLVAARSADGRLLKFLVRKFWFMGPKQSSDFEITAPFIVTDSLKKSSYTSFTDEHQIVGEVVAVAKTIEE